MKKVILAFFLLFIAFSVFAQTGIIRQLSGTVELRHPGSANFIPAASGDEVRQDTVISTGFRSNALISVGNGTLITVRPLTRLTLTEISIAAGTETLNANLQAGRVRVDVSPPAGTRASMTILGPSATASVRGTTLFFDGRNLDVSGGLATLQGDRGPPVLLGDGFSSSIDITGKPSTPLFSHMGDVLGSGIGALLSGPFGSDPSSGAGSLGDGSGLGLTGPGGNDTPPSPPGVDPDRPTGGTAHINIQY